MIAFIKLSFHVVKVFVLVSLVIYLIKDVRGDDWVCKSQAAVRKGHDSVLVCGVAVSKNEAEARLTAYSNALKEFKMTCDASSWCKGKGTSLSPERTDCRTQGGLTKCYRAVLVTVTKGHENLDGELEELEQQLSALRQAKEKKELITQKKTELKFEEEHPTYWSIGTGLVLNGVRFAGKDTFAIGSGVNVKRCFKDIFCPQASWTFGKIVNSDKKGIGYYTNLSGGASVYVYKNLYAVGTAGIEPRWGKSGAELDPTVNLGLGIDAIRVHNFSMSFEGGAKGDPRSQIRGTFNLFTNFKF